MGSGTVLVESARLGLAAHGYEVNPAAYLLARVCEFCSLSHQRGVRFLTQRSRSSVRFATLTLIFPYFVQR